MDWTHLLAFNLTLLAAMAAPGPALLYALRQSIAGGIRVGVATGAGLGLVAAGWTGAALLGLEALFTLFPFAYGAMKLAGALYLLWIAWHLWRDAKNPVSDSANPGARAFLGGMLVSLLNPKSVLFAASVLVVIFPAGLTLADKAVIVLNHFTVEICVYTAFAALLSTPPARTGYLRAKPGIDRIAALVLGALGLRLLFGR
ncbi:LysE family translocator [Antarctobacter heliothermus]|uniref:Threonine/homoserine/homoserine lactone efflux protein n=1 Tax=Antarctobacter heliothermus TaxID=74033 RepID=A0A239FP26_9RHOB|nr:LysE family translocator [Antarctobacter heliothermus]SNS58756.1 Threonine/homoserine/homoserine lactone efflux protein [Antarctobacter heliothermus]